MLNSNKNSFSTLDYNFWSRKTHFFLKKYFLRNTILKNSKQMTFFKLFSLRLNFKLLSIRIKLCSLILLNFQQRLKTRLMALMNLNLYLIPLILKFTIKLKESFSKKRWNYLWFLLWLDWVFTDLCACYPTLVALVSLKLKI